MLGVEAADNMLFGAAEVTLHHPNVANAGRNTQMQYAPPAGCGAATAPRGAGAAADGGGGAAAAQLPAA